MSKTINTRSLLMPLVIILLVCGGVVFLSVSSFMFDFFLTARPWSPLFYFWKNMPFDISLDFYLFNWTNPEYAYNHSVKPRFQELGPYKFWQREQKVNITWNDNGTLTYQQQKSWVFYSGNLKDVIVTGNPISIMASYVTRHWNYFLRRSIFLGLSYAGYLSFSVNRTVGELLFDGYREPILKIAARIPFLSYLHIPFWDNFGWLHKRNLSYNFDGVFNIASGKYKPFGQIHYWNYNNVTPFYDPVCSKVFGSSGQLFPHHLPKSKISLFTSDLGRTIYLKYTKEVRVFGLLGYKYTLDESFLDNGTLAKENKCFCGGDCLPFGVSNISSTRFGTPLFMSLPHFYKADPYYLNLIEGVEPNSSFHDSYIIIEPTSGIPLKVDFKMQLNLLIQPTTGTKFFEDINTFLLPVMWYRQTYEASWLIVFFLWYCINSRVIFLSFGTLMVSVGIFFLCQLLRKSWKVLKEKKIKNLFLEEQKVPLNKLLRIKN